MDGDEREIFKRLVERNAYNMSFESYQIIFTTELNLEKTVKDEVRKWEEQ